MSRAPLSIREATIDDLPAMVELASAALGWRRGEPNEEFFVWKHFDNPAGPSAIWVACDGGSIVGLRAFMRWRWARSDGSVVDSVRAVDTATHPGYRGLGVFRELTLHGVGRLRDEGVSFVFNTPNSSSRPGYLKMGWRELGRVPLAMRPLGIRGLMRMSSARTAAGKWSDLASAGLTAREAFDPDRSDVPSSLSEPRSADGSLSTERSAEFLAWRYGFAPLGYRIFVPDASPEQGFVAYRLRRRGSAVEVTVCDVFAPGDERGRERELMAAFIDSVGGDYLAMLDTRVRNPAGALRMSRLGPVMTWRALADSRVPALSDFDLSFGDVELF